MLSANSVRPAFKLISSRRFTHPTRLNLSDMCTRASLMCKTIKHKVKFKAEPKKIYELLADSKKHSAFSGSKASLSKKIGGTFSAYAGRMTGIVVDLRPGV